MKNIYNTPPSWCPDAVASDRGWRHPKTGELLVSVRGGVLQSTQAVLAEVESEPIIDETIIAETVIDEELPSQEVIEDEPELKQDVLVEDQPKSKKKNAK